MCSAPLVLFLRNTPLPRGNSLRLYVAAEIVANDGADADYEVEDEWVVCAKY